MGCSVRGHLWSGAIAAGCLRSVVHGHGLVGLSRVRLVLLRVRAGGHVMGTRIVSPPVLLAIPEATACGLGAVRHHLQASWDGAGRRSAPGGIR